MLNKNLQEINLANMDTELVSQMFKNYQSNVLFHLEGTETKLLITLHHELFTDCGFSDEWIERSSMILHSPRNVERGKVIRLRPDSRRMSRVGGVRGANLRFKHAVYKQARSYSHDYTASLR